MTQQRSEAPQLRAKLARSGRGLGLAPISNFLWFDRRANHKKCATVATVALLAVLCGVELYRSVVLLQKVLKNIDMLKITVVQNVHFTDHA